VVPMRSDNKIKEFEKEFQDTVESDRRKVEEPTRGTVKVNDINKKYKAGYKVKKKENKRAKIEIELLITYLKLAKMDYANGIEELKLEVKSKKMDIKLLIKS
ncbi:19276_t:CDS:2, partial [Gigaspora margarita]